MVIYWPNITLPRGTAYGYHVHVSKLAEALTAAGVELTEDPGAPSDIAVTLTLPNLFSPVPGKRNILFTMAETDSVPQRFAETLRGADVLVVPCCHNVDVFRTVYSGPIEVCPEGIDAELFPSHERKAPAAGGAVPFPLVRIPDPRKGAGLLMYAWQQWAASGRKPPDVQLYMKVSRLDVGSRTAESGSSWTGATSRVPSLPSSTGTRTPSSCRARGRGGGSRLSDALASGLPSIWTHYSGPMDYADESTGFPLTRLDPLPMRMYGDHETFGRLASVEEIIERMEEILADYPAALARGRLASERMHSRFTWAHAAARFLEILATVREPVPV